MEKTEPFIDLDKDCQIGKVLSDYLNNELDLMFVIQSLENQVDSLEDLTD